MLELRGKSSSLVSSLSWGWEHTLVGDDHTQLAAHKLVLSACSEYFKEIFKRNKHANTLLCLEGLSQQDIGNVLDYMYNGEVHIFQEDLDRFLSIAQRLRLEGLLGDGSESDEQHSTPNETRQYLEERSSEQTYEQKPKTTQTGATFPLQVGI